MYHYHHSTKFMYNTMLARKEEQVHCPTCKEVHPINQEEEKVTIIMSTSSLHNCFLYESVKANIHVNMETISGGTVDLLRASWNQLYWNEPKAMNVIVIAGLNDVPRYEADRIFNDIILFKKNVKQQNPKNLFLMAGMLCPPKYVWY